MRGWGASGPCGAMGRVQESRPERDVGQAGLSTCAGLWRWRAALGSGKNGPSAEGVRGGVCGEWGQVSARVGTGSTEGVRLPGCGVE